MVSKKSQNRRRLGRTTLPGDHFVLVQLPSGEERLEPIVDLSPEGAAILLRTTQSGVGAGSTLPRLRFFTRGTCTLDAAATVRDVTQVSLEEGGTGLKVGIRLSLGDSQTGEFKVYNDPLVIQDAIANLVQARAEATFVPAASVEQEEAIPTRFLRTVASGHVVLDLAEHTLPGADSEQHVQVVCELYGTRLALIGRAQHDSKGNVLLFRPQSLRVWSHRTSSRLRQFQTRITVSFESPFTLKRTGGDVLDISFGGLAFVSAPADGLMVGMRLRRLAFRVADGEMRGVGIVRNVRYDSQDRLLVGIELTELSETCRSLLHRYISANVRPKLRCATVKDLNALWTVYDEAGLFQRQHAALSPIIGRIETTRKVLLERGKNLLSQIVGVHDDHPEGSAELIRTYSQTWTLQHLGILPTSRLTSDQLVAPLIEDALQDKSLRFLQASFDPSKSNGALMRLRSVQPDGEQLCWREWRVYTPRDPPSHGIAKPSLDVQHASQQDFPWIVQRIQERFLPVEVGALDLCAAELTLSSIGQAYHRIGLERRRIIRMAMGVSGPLGFSLIEQSSPGLNFAGSTDAIRIMLTTTSDDTRRQSLEALAIDALSLQRGMGRKHCMLLLSPEDSRLLSNNSGFGEINPRMEVCASASGARQVLNFLSLMAQ